MLIKLDEVELLDELETIFLSEGYRDVTFRKLASRLNCSNRKLYALSPSKEELFLKVITRFFSKTKKLGWEEARSQAELSVRIRNYLRVGINAASRASPQFNQDIELLPAGRVLFDEFQKDRIDGLQQLIQEGISNGEFEGFRAQLVAEVMIQSARRVRDPDFLLGSNMSFAEALQELSRLVRFGLIKR